MERWAGNEWTASIRDQGHYAMGNTVPTKHLKSDLYKPEWARKPRIWTQSQLEPSWLVLLTSDVGNTRAIGDTTIGLTELGADKQSE